ncbi:MAG: translation elongation factor Ts [Candidatus Doudnabacteria bacterium RIFCSPLOWO2_02_FULL_48_8]|uniref:Elongation factor Ts n=1 Tax=Candidatus Doudnabacteria bacterium RIFCSPHIGHO2_01_FULL_46_24 TaxID=1817825 RepID=A0A1F5NX60_9BACT|nr:MAG: translation elongation factor Ts [Candidatus Doudnabacteria bacterium RIFCSPHIGHO2_01_FULL_46_24]OGE95165.1 MAG: translation elongation factor Ts [Candidatus Doudnabacteria bacterium RIFCSPLOWO2_02_FULL_48_8]OGE95371.1 MAG: translation elongation factor Ts [Candidatus Doudnabacteria bacterium RIFCSPHIGHO2_12_FULL_48_11]
MQITTDDVKKLRDQTGAGMMDAKKALQEAGNFEEAVKLLQKRGHAAMAKKSERAAGEGLIVSYVHTGSKVGVLLELNCETDFVARNEEFKKLAQEVAMQIAAVYPVDVSELLEQDYIRDPQKKVKDLVAETVGKLGENIQLRRFTRYVLGS